MKTVAMAAAIITVSATVAFAQVQPLPRGFVVVNGGYQFTSNDFSEGATKRENGEDGRFDTTYTVNGGFAFDIAGGGIVWRNVGVGVGVSRFSVSTPSSLTATIPHPFFFNRARAVSGDVGGLNREELGVHVQVRGVFPIGARMQAMLFGGPSFFHVNQGLVTDFTYSESYPYDDAAFTTAATSEASGSKAGFNAGADVAFFFTRQLGVGGTVQFTSASVDLPAAAGQTTSVKAGGGRAGGGLRIRF